MLYISKVIFIRQRKRKMENTGFDVDDEETGYGWYLAQKLVSGE
ncbi:MAG: hypothetical protein ACLTAT_11070 [Lachnospira eligens]